MKGKTMAGLGEPIEIKINMEKELLTMVKSFDERLRRIEQHIRDEKFERIENYADNLFERH